MNPIKIEFPQLINEALNPLAKSIGETLRSVWDIAFGGISSYDQKLQYKRLIATNKFKAELEAESSKIPTSDLCEPKISVIGPALEASKYYFDEDKLRHMFTKLIANSMNVKTASNVHPSFIEIIKQLSTNDAMLLKEIAEYNDYIPAINISIVMKQQGMHILGQAPLEKSSPYTVTFQLNPQIPEDEQIISLDNLHRLGIIVFNNVSLAGNSKYEFAKNTKLYQDSQEEFNKLKAQGESPDHILIKRKCLHLTAMGTTFCNICILDSNAEKIDL